MVSPRAFVYLLLCMLPIVTAAPINIKVDEYEVKNLEGLSAIPEEKRPIMSAGHIELDAETETRYFFWKFRKQNSNFNKTIIWLNGGPGCSSMDGALMEVGPLRVDPNGQDLYLNEGSWYKSADLIFVDQPGGTGFSTTKNYDKDLSQVADEFLKFLKLYYTKYPEDLEKELYIAGESYAGQYIPFIADRILDSNSHNNTQINLKGLLIGNGWIAPNLQSLSYIPYLLENEVIHKTDSYFPQLLKSQEECQNLMNRDGGDVDFEIRQCENILNRVLQATRIKDGPKNEQCINMYDIRLRDSYPSCGMNWPPDLPQVSTYLQNENVILSLNLDTTKVKKWRECDGDVSTHLKNKDTKPSFTLLPSLLSQLDIVLFGGDQDIICNNVGVKDLISKMTWGGEKGFTDAAAEYDWKYNDSFAGRVQNERNLTFIDVFNSSHMVPFDKPFESRGLFDFITNNFKVIDSDDGPYVETPIYRDSDASKDTTSPKNSQSHKSSLPFFLYLLVFVVIGLILYIINRRKTQKKGSILKNKKKQTKGKKKVSWADEHLHAQPQRDPSEQKNSSPSKIANVLSGLKNKGYKRAPTSDDPFNEEIELEAQMRRADEDYEDVDFDLDDETDEAAGTPETENR